MEQVVLTELYSRIENLAKANPKFGSVKGLEIAVGLNPSVIQKWKNHSPSADKLLLVAQALDVSMEYLLTGKDMKPINTQKTDNMPVSIQHKNAPSLAFENDYADLLDDKNFIETAKLYNGVSVEIRSVVFGIVLGAMQTLKVDTKKILGY